jgi:hypothetical protein
MVEVWLAISCFGVSEILLARAAWSMSRKSRGPHE